MELEDDPLDAGLRGVNVIGTPKAALPASAVLICRDRVRTVEELRFEFRADDGAVRVACVGPIVAGRRVRNATFLPAPSASGVL